MIKEALNNPALWIWPTAALLIFFSVMILVYLWIMRPRAEVLYNRMANLIFEDDQQQGDSTHVNK